MATDKKTYKYEVPLDGKLNTWDDPSKIGTDFQQLTNLRYTETHPKGVGGMTKINTNVMDATYLKPRSAFHYTKDQPAESHVLAEAFNTDLTASQILDNETAIPTAGQFTATEVYTPTMAATPKAGTFSKAPDGDMAYCNGEESCIWGGDEREVGAFITSTADITNAITNPKDYTVRIRNTLQTAGEIANVGGGNDSYTELLLHMDGADASTTFTDSSSNNHGDTAVDNAQMDTDQKKFGTASGLFDGTGDYVTYADHANWFMSTGRVTIDFWVRFNTVQTSTFYYQKNAAGGAYVSFHYKTAATAGWQFIYYDGAAIQIIVDGAHTPAVNTWYHIALIRGWGDDNDDWAITVDGTQVGTTVTDATAWPDLDQIIHIGAASAANYHDGWIDEYRISKGVARWEANFTPPAKAYAADTKYFVIGSIRPLQGCKLYISDGNTEATPTLTITYWNGTAWTAVAGKTDNTTGLGTTGTVTWTSTVAEAKPKYLNGYYLYFYKFVLSAGYADVYHVTVDAPFQEVVDIWDGVHRPIDSFQVYEDSIYKEYTSHVREDDFVSTNTGSYAEVDLLQSATEYLVCGFAERMTAVYFTFVAGKGNTTAATATLVYYWNGAAWVQLLGVSDGTIENSIAFGGTGVISWSHPNPEDEFPKTISNDVELYYYKFAFDQHLTDDTELYHILGIPIQRTVGAYTFPLYANNRLWLCNDAKEKPNTAICSGLESSCIFNGDTSIKVAFGDETGLTAGAWLYGAYNSNVYNIILFFKKSETWVLVGDHPGNWIRYKISDVVGCVARETVRVVDLGEMATRYGLNRVVAIWQAADGIYLSDGRQPICISTAIQDKFDKRVTGSIYTTKIADSYSDFDNDNKCYHWLWASGTSTTLNEEYVYDFIKQGWFNIDRTSTKDLQAAITVKTTTGVNYNYGFIDTGYMERLEYGTAFDGQDITHTLHFGDMVLAEGSITAETTIQYSCLIATAKTTTTADITITHYGDGYSTGTEWTESPTRASYRVIYPVEHQSLGAHIFHSIKISTTTDDETIGFEPLYFYMLYEITREHLKSWR